MAVVLGVCEGFIGYASAAKVDLSHPLKLGCSGRSVEREECLQINKPETTLGRSESREGDTRCLWKECLADENMLPLPSGLTQ